MVPAVCVVGVSLQKRNSILCAKCLPRVCLVPGGWALAEKKFLNYGTRGMQFLSFLPVFEKKI